MSERIQSDAVPVEANGDHPVVGCVCGAAVEGKWAGIHEASCPALTAPAIFAGSADRLDAELACNKTKPDHAPVIDSSLTYGDLRFFSYLLGLLADAEHAVEEYSCRTPVAHIATEMGGLARDIRHALKKLRTAASG